MLFFRLSVAQATFRMLDVPIFCLLLLEGQAFNAVSDMH